jgi:hypothetical protein
MIGDNKCGFRRNRSVTDQIFCIRQILKKKWEYNETVHQIFIYLRKAYDLFRREVYVQYRVWGTHGTSKTD